MGGACCPDPYHLGPGNLLCNSASTFCNSTSDNSWQFLRNNYDVSKCREIGSDCSPWCTSPKSVSRMTSKIRASGCRTTCASKRLPTASPWSTGQHALPSLWSSAAGREAHAGPPGWVTAPRPWGWHALVTRRRVRRGEPAWQLLDTCDCPALVASQSNCLTAAQRRCHAVCAAVLLQDVLRLDAGLPEGVPDLPACISRLRKAWKEVLSACGWSYGPQRGTIVPLLPGPLARLHRSNEQRRGVGVHSPAEVAGGVWRRRCVAQKRHAAWWWVRQCAGLEGRGGLIAGGMQDTA